MISPLLNSGPCNCFYCLGHSKNVYDDDDDENGFRCQKIGVVSGGPENLHFLFLAAPAGKAWATGRTGKP